MIISGPDLNFYPPRISDPGSRGQKDTGFRIPDPDQKPCKKISFSNSLGDPKVIQSRFFYLRRDFLLIEPDARVVDPDPH
jgi:hypothetical protein